MIRATKYTKCIQKGNSKQAKEERTQNTSSLPLLEGQIINETYCTHWMIIHVHLNLLKKIHMKEDLMAQSIYSRSSKALLSLFLHKVQLSKTSTREQSSKVSLISSPQRINEVSFHGRVHHSSYSKQRKNKLSQNSCLFVMKEHMNWFFCIFTRKHLFDIIHPFFWVDLTSISFSKLFPVQKTPPLIEPKVSKLRLQEMTLFHHKPSKKKLTKNLPL